MTRASKVFKFCLQIATFMQLVTCATVFYSTEIWGHYNTGERAAMVWCSPLGNPAAAYGIN